MSRSHRTSIGGVQSAQEPNNRVNLRAVVNKSNTNNGDGATLSQRHQTQRKQVGNYIVGKAIGEGTFGKVKLGIHIPTGEKVAVKILEKARIKDQADIRRVNREIKILKRVRHPNIIRLYEVLDTQNAIYLIMEICEGGEVFDYIVKHKHLKEPQACTLFHQIVDGLEALHKFEVTHRDLKPENLLLKASPDGWIVKIVDFGLSNTHDNGRLLQTACGSPCYAAPEMIAGKPYEGPKADTWSLGVVLFALVCGYLPFEDQNTAHLYKKILSGDYRPAKWISPSVRDLIRKILETEPSKRFTIDTIRKHQWYNNVPQENIPSEILPEEMAKIRHHEVMNMVRDIGTNPQAVEAAIISGQCNGDSAVYYLLEQKIRKRDYAIQQQEGIKFSQLQQRRASHNSTQPSSEYMAQQAAKMHQAQESSQNNQNLIVTTIDTGTGSRVPPINTKAPVMMDHLAGTKIGSSPTSVDTYERQRKQHENFMKKVEQNAAKREQQRPSKVPPLNININGGVHDSTNNNILTSKTARGPNTYQQQGAQGGKQIQSARTAGPGDTNAQTMAATGMKVQTQAPKLIPVMPIPDILGGGSDERPSTRRSRSRGGARPQAGTATAEVNVGNLVSDSRKVEAPHDGTTTNIQPEKQIPITAMKEGLELPPVGDLIQAVAGVALETEAQILPTDQLLIPTSMQQNIQVDGASGNTPVQSIHIQNHHHQQQQQQQPVGQDGNSVNMELTPVELQQQAPATQMQTAPDSTHIRENSNNRNGAPSAPMAPKGSSTGGGRAGRHVVATSPTSTGPTTTGAGHSTTISSVLPNQTTSLPMQPGSPTSPGSPANKPPLVNATITATTASINPNITAAQEAAMNKASQQGSNVMTA